MSNGVIAIAESYIPMSNLSASIVNRAAQAYRIGLPNQRDIGHISDNTSFNIYLWNGTSNDAVLSNVSVDNPFITWDIPAPETINAKKSIKEVITVLISGPETVNSNITFQTSCSNNLFKIIGVRESHNYITQTLSTQSLQNELSFAALEFNSSTEEAQSKQNELSNSNLNFYSTVIEIQTEQESYSDSYVVFNPYHPPPPATGTGFAHRDTDSRAGGSVTVSKQSRGVYVNGLLWAVEGDPNSYGHGELISSQKKVFIGGKPAILAGDLAQPDDRCNDDHPLDCNPFAIGSSPNLKII